MVAGDGAHSGDDHSTTTSRFETYIKNSSVGFACKGAYGVGYRVNLHDISKSDYNILTLLNPTHGSNSGSLFVKLMPIVDNVVNDDVADSIESLLDIHLSETQDVMKEIHTQTDIYKKSNSNLEAICPPIVYSTIIQGDDASNLISILISQMTKETDINYLQQMKQLYTAEAKIQSMKLGIIAMTFAENYKPLHQIVTSRTHHTNEQKMKYIYLAMYELVRLYDIGYIHGDFHMSNIMVNTDYTYSVEGDPLLSGRCLLIDFGLTFKPSRRWSSAHSLDDKLQVIMDIPHPYTDENAHTWEAYQWLPNFIKSETDLNTKYNNIQNSISIFQTQMIAKIHEKYPLVLDTIRAINATDYRADVLRGGKMVLDTSVPVIDSITYPSRKMEAPFVLTDKVFEKLFNPGKANMSDFMNKHEKTLRDGILSSSNNATKNITGGKRMNRVNRINRINRMNRMNRANRMNRMNRAKRSKCAKRAKRGTRGTCTKRGKRSKHGKRTKRGKRTKHGKRTKRVRRTLG
jgi:hypothetical protein